MKTAKYINDTELKMNGITALNKILGSFNALRFLSLIHNEPTDYVKISRQTYKNQSISEIYDRAEKSWKKRI